MTTTMAIGSTNPAHFSRLLLPFPHTVSCPYKLTASSKECSLSYWRYVRRPLAPSYLNSQVLQGWPHSYVAESMHTRVETTDVVRCPETLCSKLYISSYHTCHFQVALMHTLPPPDGLLTVRDSGELHITPLTKCPECHRPLPYLSVNNGFTRREDTGKLQQWVWPRFAVCWI